MLLLAASMNDFIKDEIYVTRENDFRLQKLRVVAVCNCITPYYSCTLDITISGRKHVFAYFLFHVCRWIILDGALNIPIFSRYLRQHYQKIILQFDVLNLRTRKRTDNESQNNTNGDWIISNIKGAFESVHSYKKHKHIHIFAHWNLSCGISARKSPDFYCNVYSVCFSRLLVSALAYLSSDVYRSARLSGNRFWMRPVAQYSWLMTSYCQHGDYSHFFICYETQNSGPLHDAI